MSKRILALCTLVISSVALGHGGGATQPRAGAGDNHQESPLRMALDNYRQGQKYLDKALSIEQRTERTTKAKKKAKLNKKANKQYKKAARKFVEAIKYEPLLYQAHAALGYVQNHFGDHKAALKSYGKALILKPRNAQTIAHRAQTYLVVGRLDETKVAYAQLLRLDRGKADELMLDMRRWTQDLADNEVALKNDEVVAFGQWIEKQ